MTASNATTEKKIDIMTMFVGSERPIIAADTKEVAKSARLNSNGRSNWERMKQRPALTLTDCVLQGLQHFHNHNKHRPIFAVQLYAGYARQHRNMRTKAQ